ncbi:Vacuolar morphogenesis protein 6 [Tilletia horrida]|nr:Vacuolar morphogenesis protein 6 [Tilletia horrida]
MHAAFTPHQVLRGYKEKAESLLVHGGKLFLGSAQGNLTIYRLNEGPDVPQDQQASFLETRKAFSRRAIEKLAAIKEANLLVSLSDGQVCLHDLADLSAATPLPQTKGALDFAMDSSIQRKVAPAAAAVSAATAYRPSSGSATLPRSRTSTAAAYANASLRGMEALVLEKEAQEKELLLAESEKQGDGDDSTPAVLSLVTVLAVGCRRKILIFRWVDGTFWDTKELALPHSPRSIAFPNPTSLFMSYSATDFTALKLPLASSSSCAAIHDNGSLSISRSTSVPTSSTSGEFVDTSSWTLAKDISIPLATAENEASDKKDSDTASLAGPSGGIGIPASTSTSAGFGAAFSGLGGYIGIGRGANKTSVHAMDKDSILIVRGTNSILVDADGRASRRDTIQWPVAPDEVAFATPYIFSILPNCGLIATHFKDSAASPANQPVVQIRSAGTFTPVQSIPFPPHLPEDTPEAHLTHPPAVQLLTPVTPMKPPLYLVMTPSDRERGATALDKRGATIYRLDMQSWSSQINELVDRQHFSEALALLDSVDEVILEEKPKLQAHVKSLYGLSLYANAEYDKAIETFIELDTNPAKVLALFPEFISGPLSRPRDQWLTLFGGRPSSSAAPAFKSDLKEVVEGSPGKLKPESLADSDKRSLRSIRSARDMRAHATNEERNFDALGRFLADRRRIFKPILEANKASHLISSSAWREETDRLFTLADAPLHTLPAQDLSVLAQAVDTALFKTFLATKPALVGPLCRVENWCEVEQVEEMLKQRNKNSELVALYSGKNMHDKALALLKKLAENQDDEEEKLGPSIRYLQNLDAEFIDIILDASHWILDENPQMGMEIFTADTGKVGQLPRYRIVEDLATYDRDMCIIYLEHIIGTLNDGDPSLHERLASLYLTKAADLAQMGDADLRSKTIDKLARFLEISEQYRPERLLNKLPENDLFEPRAILLGRMGQHEAALSIYVYRLDAHDKADSYCTNVYSSRRRSGDEHIYLTLLRIYLRPKEGVLTSSATAKEGSSGPSMLQPALALIGRHGSRIDADQVFDLLPPLVTVQSILPFAQQTLQHSAACRNGLRIEAGIRKERSLQADEQLNAIKMRKVRVQQGTSCLRCHRKLGNSVVVLAEGGLMHYSCKTER